MNFKFAFLTRQIQFDKSKNKRRKMIFLFLFGHETKSISPPDSFFLDMHSRINNDYTFKRLLCYIKSGIKIEYNQKINYLVGTCN